MNGVNAGEFGTCNGSRGITRQRRNAGNKLYKSTSDNLRKRIENATLQQCIHGSVLQGSLQGDFLQNIVLCRIRVRKLKSGNLRKQNSVFMR